MELDNYTKLHPVQSAVVMVVFSPMLGFALIHTVITQELYIQRAEITADVESGFHIYFHKERMKLVKFLPYQVS